MKITKIILALAVLFFFSTGAFAQSEKLLAKAQEKTEKLNKSLTAGDENAALTTEQREKIDALYVGMIKEMRGVNKSEATDEEKKAKKKEVRKATSKQVSAILTKEQRMAKKAARAAKE